MGQTLTTEDKAHFERILERIKERKGQGGGIMLLQMFEMHLHLSLTTGTNELPWRGDLLGRVLAYAWLSGMDEQCVFNGPLNAVIQVAQHYFGIINAGNHMPESAAMVEHFFPRVKQLGEAGKACEWLAPLAERYHIEVKWQQFEQYYADEKANVERWLAGAPQTAEDTKAVKKRIIRDRETPDETGIKPRIIRDR